LWLAHKDFPCWMGTLVSIRSWSRKRISSKQHLQPNGEHMLIKKCLLVCQMQ
ncbi:hypothetical protein KI387_019056, partial [Taxus chinensis]